MKKEKNNFSFLVVFGGVYLIFCYLSYLIDIKNLIAMSIIFLMLIITILLFSKIRACDLFLNKIKLIGIYKIASFKYNYQPIKYFKMFLTEFFISFSLLLYVIYLENYVAHSDFYSFILSPIVSYFLARAICNLIEFFNTSSEESNKRGDDIHKLKELYYDNYLRAIKVIDKEGNKDKFYQFMYDAIVDNFSDKELIIIDDKTSFSLSPLVEGRFYELLKANSTATMKNFSTIRLNDVVVSDSSIEIHVGRSRMYYDLVTNRIPDLKISGITTIRELYEGGPSLSPLPESQLSNHIGINAIVILVGNDNNKEVILPIRDGFATMSKYQTTSSLAFALTDNDKDINSDFIRYKVVEEKLEDDYNVSNKYINKTELVGIGRDIYSAGKPQLYYVVELNIDSDKFLECYLAKKTNFVTNDDDIVNKTQKKHNNLKIDSYKYVSIVSLDDLINLKYKGEDNFEIRSKLINNDLLHNVNKVKKKYGKEINYMHRFEKSFLANLYHYFITNGHRNNVK